MLEKTDSPVGGNGGMDLLKRSVLSLEWKREMTNGNNGNEGNGELMCVKSDKSDKVL